jgi:2-oxo-4-hydroxy-4-carboxy-5-ureidoimidazoline decarboxylase
VEMQRVNATAVFITSHQRRITAAILKVFGDIYEHSPWAAEKAFDLGQDATINQVATVHQRMAERLLSAGHDPQLALINAHPGLAGKAAVRGELTASSTSEQSGAVISECTAEEFTRFTELNNTYKARFGLPFIMAVKGRNRHQILAASKSASTTRRSRNLAGPWPRSTRALCSACRRCSATLSGPHCLGRDDVKLTP